MRSRSTTEGYLTVTLSLVLTVLLSLVLAFFTSARLGAAGVKAEMVTEIALDSTLAEYHQALFERYDLLLLDTSYGTAVADVCNTEEHLRKYVQMNLSASTASAFSDTANLTGLTCCSVEIPVFTRAMDGNGAVLRRQILDYMRAEPVEEAFSDAFEHVELLRAKGYDTRDVASEMDKQYAELNAKMAEKGLSEADAENDTDLFAVQKKRRLGILTLAHPDRASVSDAACTPSVYVSGRGAGNGNGYTGGEDLSLADRLLLDQYLMEKCGYHGTEREGSRLQYQLEYIIAGKGSDYENLESVAKRLLAWREAANYAYIQTDSAKKTAAGAAAWALALLLLSPSLKEPIKQAMLFAWSFAESVSDVRILLSGGKVPLVKTSDTWKLSLTNLLSFGSGQSGKTGLDYEAYLRMLLVMTDMETKTMRLADIMEMDIRETEGNLHFRIDGCLDAFTVRVGIGNALGFDALFTRSASYSTRPESEKKEE